eukprot:2423989-Ditylum_brightwellii.AAC.2
MTGKSDSFDFKFVEGSVKIISLNALEPIYPGISGAAVNNQQCIFYSTRHCGVTIGYVNMC